MNRKGVTSEWYHDNQFKERNPMEYVRNKGVIKGGWVYGKKVLQEIALVAIFDSKANHEMEA